MTHPSNLWPPYMISIFLRVRTKLIITSYLAIYWLVLTGVNGEVGGTSANTKEVNAAALTAN